MAGEEQTRARPLALTIAKWAAIVVAALLALVALVVLGLNTGPGRRFVVNQLDGYELASGMRINVEALDGSLYGKLTIRNLRLSDPTGQFASAPRIDLDWRPFAAIRDHVDVRSAYAPLLNFDRIPVLRETPTDPDAPLLPDIDIDIGRLKVDRLVLGAPVTGARRTLALDGRAKIADGRAQVTAGAASRDGGDRLAVTLDAVPEQNRLQIDGRLYAPAGGVVAGAAGLTQPLVATLGGRGSWAEWRGRLDARLGGQPLALIDVTAREGRIDLAGPLRPGLILAGPVERLTAPALLFNAAIALDQRRADTRISLRSPALAVQANGLLDLGTSRFGDFKVMARLLTPGAIADNLSGRDVRAELALDGAFARPVIDYKIFAAALGFDQTVVEGLYAEGRGRIDADRILIPVNARARRITGLNAAAGQLLTNVRVQGDFAYAAGKLLSDNLRLRSPQIDATAIVVADLANGLYRGGLKGRINDYRIDGVAIINLTTDVDLVTTRTGFQLQGRFGADTVRILNPSAADFLGGRTVVTGRLRYDPEGLATVENLRLTAPRFRITEGRGSYRPDGRIAFVARGSSNQYGPLAVDVSGTVERPLVRLRAARPNVGVQLTDVEAVVRGTAAGYAIVATGGSPYGPFNADVLVRTGRGPLTIDINRARFAGIDIAGTVRQAAAGPFTGQLTANGSGIRALVTLAAVGRYQQARVSARANGARIPGQAGLIIDRAIVEAVATLYPTPEVVADVQLAGVRQGALLIQTARAKVNYRGGSGSAQLVASGRSGASFQLAANAALSPGRYRVAATGRLANVPFRLAQPAVITAEGGGYRLQPVAIVVPQGEVRVAGRYGSALEAQARFRNFDIALLNAFAPGAGLGGRATGGLDFVQSGNAFPRADLRVGVSNFTRSGAVAVSTPVDLVTRGQLAPESGGTLNALVRRGGATIGRAQVRLAPGGGGSWSESLSNGALSGGLRYNGPAEVLWSLAAIPGQSVSGPIGIAADVSGTLVQPRAVGVVRANALTYDNETYGTRISAIRLTGRFTNDRFEIAEFAGRAGQGTVTARGSVGFAAGSGFPIDLAAQLNNAQLARSDALSARVSGDVRVTNDREGAFIRGTLRLPEVRYEIVRQGAAEVSELSGVRRKNVSREAAAEAARVAASGAPGLFNLDLRVQAPERLYVSGMGLESEWSADLRVTGTSAAPVVAGEVELVRGTYSFASRRFELDRSSVIRFSGGPATNPSLQIAATADIQGTAVTINITGRALNPQIALTSNPVLPQDELLSRILFGNSITELSATQAIQLASALNSLRGSGGGLNPLGKLRSATGIDRLRILGADETTGRGTAVAAGQYISNDIYVEVITDTRGFTATQIEIALSRALSLLSQAGGSNGTAVNLRYSRDY